MAESMKFVDADSIDNPEFNICCGKTSKIGSFGCGCCNSKEISEMTRQVKIGPAMFLMQTKALSWFFLLLTIINLPLLGFNFWGNDKTEDFMISKVFTKLSLGNIGHD